MLKFASLCVLWLCVASKVTGSGHTHDLAAFSVGRKTEFVPSKTSRIPMDDVHYNEGGHFNTATNVYTAPVTGLYSIFFGASGYKGKLVHLLLYAGNPEKKVARTYDYTKGHGQAGSRVLLKLNAGDSCSMWMMQAGGHYGLDAHTILFNGYLLKKL